METCLASCSRDENQNDAHDMGNVVAKAGGLARNPSLSKRSQSSGSAKAPSRLSSLSRLVRRSITGQAAAANSRHQLEARLAEVIKAKAAGADASAKKVSFNRLLLRFGTLHEGFQACRQVFSDLVGGLEDGELSQAQLQEACRTLGYNLDDASLATIFDGTDIDGSRALNVHEFLATMAILHILKGPEDVERVPAAVLASWRTAEQAFMAFASSRHGWIEKDELMAMMHEGATDQVRHSDRGSGGDPIRSIAQKRFEELDKFHTGRVSFLEFLFCLEGWVDDAEEEAAS